MSYRPMGTLGETVLVRAQVEGEGIGALPRGCPCCGSAMVVNGLGGLDGLATHAGFRCVTCHSQLQRARRRTGPGNDDHDWESFDETLQESGYGEALRLLREARAEQPELRGIALGGLAR